jgi:hypothetical protein
MLGPRRSHRYRQISPRRSCGLDRPQRHAQSCPRSVSGPHWLAEEALHQWLRALVEEPAGLMQRRAARHLQSRFRPEAQVRVSAPTAQPPLPTSMGIPVCKKVRCCTWWSAAVRRHLGAVAASRPHQLASYHRPVAHPDRTESMRNRNPGRHRMARTLDKRSRGTAPAQRTGEVQKDFGQQGQHPVVLAKVQRERCCCPEGVAWGVLHYSAEAVRYGFQNWSAMSASFGQAFGSPAPCAALALKPAAAGIG